MATRLWARAALRTEDFPVNRTGVANIVTVPNPHGSTIPSCRTSTGCVWRRGARFDACKLNQVSADLRDRSERRSHGLVYGRHSA